MEEDWQNKCTSKKQRDLHLLESGIGADCKFLVGVEAETRVIIEAHKYMLWGASPVFFAMFCGSLPEKGETPILIDDIESPVFKQLLKYIYTDEVNLTTNENAMKLFYTADKYMLKVLKELCVSFLEKKINSADVCEVYEFAKRFELKPLDTKCSQFISFSTSEVLKSKAFNMASFSTVDHILSLDQMNIRRELELFCALEKYALQRYSIKQQSDRDNDSQSSTWQQEEKSHTNTESSEKAGKQESKDETKANRFTQEEDHSTNHLRFKKLVQKIRFRNMTPNEFANGPALSNLISKADALAILVCLIAPNKVKTHFPSGFSVSTEQRMTPNKVKTDLPSGFSVSTEQRMRLCVHGVEKQQCYHCRYT